MSETPNTNTESKVWVGPMTRQEAYGLADVGAAWLFDGGQSPHVKTGVEKLRAALSEEGHEELDAAADTWQDRDDLPEHCRRLAKRAREIVNAVPSTSVPDGEDKLREALLSSPAQEAGRLALMRGNADDATVAERVETITRALLDANPSPASPCLTGEAAKKLGTISGLLAMAAPAVRKARSTGQPGLDSALMTVMDAVDVAASLPSPASGEAADGEGCETCNDLLREIEKLEDRFEFCDNCERPAREGDLSVVWARDAESGEQVDARICLVCHLEAELQALTGEEQVRLLTKEIVEGSDGEVILLPYEVVKDALATRLAALRATPPTSTGGGEEAEHELWTGVANIAWCPKHGLHGARDTCFECGEPVEQIPMVPVSELESIRGALRSLAGGPKAAPISRDGAEALLAQAEGIAQEAGDELDRLTSAPPMFSTSKGACK